MKNQLIFGLSVCLLLVAGLPADQGSIDDVASVKLNISMGHRTFPSKRQIQENQETQIMDIFEIWQDSLPDPSAMLSSDVWTMNIPFELDSLFSMMRRPQTLFELEFILPDEQSKNIIPLKTLPLNVGFMTTVRIGSDGREFSMILDSGSADAWVPSSDCNQASCHGHIRYNPSQSSGSVSTGHPLKVTYGTGTVAGNIFEDTLQLGEFVLTKYPVGAIVKQSTSFASQPFDGILGLGFQNLSAYSDKSLLDRLAEQNMIPQKMFSLYLNRHGESPSFMQLGGMDPKLVDGELTEIPLVSDVGYWMVKMDKIAVTVNGVTRFLNFEVTNAILDTGSTLIVAPKGVAKVYHKLIPGAKRMGWRSKLFVFPCANIPQTNVSFVFNGRSIQIAPEELAMVTVDGGKTCVSSVQDSDGKEWVLGGAFLRNIYSVWNAEKKTVSFSKKKTLNL